MGLWNWWRRTSRDAEVDEPEGQLPADDVEEDVTAPIPLPREPYVFECHLCGKLFEARRKRPLCPECDSSDVEQVS